MRDYRDAKTMAKALRASLAEDSLTVTHSQSLELMARAFGFDNWNILAAKIGTGPAAAEPEAWAERTLYCSFCGKSQHDVQKLIAGPHTFICDECVALCNNIVEHSVVMKLLVDDEREGGEDRPRVSAYLAGRTGDQLRAYLADMELDLTRTREGIRSMDETAEARADGRPSGPAYKDVSDEELARRRGRLDRQLGGTLKIFDIVTKTLEARE